MLIQVKNFNSVYQGQTDIVEDALNIKYALNGTGESTLAKTISAGIKGDDKALQSLKPYAFLDKTEDKYKPQTNGIDAFRSVMMFGAVKKVPEKRKTANSLYSGNAVFFVI